MTRNELILFGAGGHARSCIDVIEQEANFKITGLVGLESDLGSLVNGYEVIATDESLLNLDGRDQFALIALGQISSPDARIKLCERALKAGFELVVRTERHGVNRRANKMGAEHLLFFRKVQDKP